MTILVALPGFVADRYKELTKITTAANKKNSNPITALISTKNGKGTILISKSTAGNDYFTKCRYYMEYGVKEYWIVDLYANQIVVYLNQEDGSPIVHKYTFEDQVKVSLFDDLYIDFNEVRSGLASLPN